MSQQILAHVEAASLNPNVDSFEIGDTVDVHNRILEGSKERIQIFKGVVIARSGSGSRVPDPSDGCGTAGRARQVLLSIRRGSSRRACRS